MQQHRREIVSHIDLNLQFSGKSNGFHHFFGQTESSTKIYRFRLLLLYWRNVESAHTLRVVEKFTNEQTRRGTDT